ncbi:MAG TPA: hypothetical protein VFE72_08540, partial [Lysobacter sp.]|nr:hypothetical protein [Lysobacter sp.]
MSLPWSPQQIEWLQAMGLDVLRLNDAGDPGADAAPVPVIVAGVEQESIGAATAAIPRGLVRAARGVDLSPLLAALGP